MRAPSRRAPAASPFSGSADARSRWREAAPRLAAEHPAQFRVLAIGWLLAAVGFAAAALGPREWAIALDNAQQLVAAAALLAASVLTARRSPAEETRRFAAEIGLAAALFLVAMTLWDLAGSTVVSAAYVPLLASAALVALASLRGPLFRGLDRAQLLLVCFDCAVVFIAALTLLGGASRRWFTWDAASWEWLFAIGLAAAIASAAAAASFALLARQIAPSRRGPWPAVAGVVAGAAAWLGWLAMPLAAASGVTPFDFLLSASLLVLGHGVVTWDVALAGPRQPRPRLVRARDGLPAAAALACVFVAFVHSDVADLVEFGAAAVVFVVLMRQVFLSREHRRVSGSERAALRELKREMAERAETSLAITGLAQGRSVAETAQRICDAALGVHPVDMACISSVDSSGTLRLVAATGLDDRLREYIGEAIPADRAAALNAKAGTGPWVGGEGEWHSSRGGRAGPPVTIANVPLLWNERLVGIIALGARLEWGDLEPPQLAIAREFAAVAAALLGPQLVAEEEAAATRAAISGVIQSRAFRPAFQPVIELASGATVGFEALTRFSDGTRPDLRFAQAAKAGLGIPLELATLEAAVDEASLLPEGAWVSLNVSPELAVALVPLASILEGLDRRAVIEITEHTLFEDYEGLTTALATLRRNVRISIDDAGAGFAGLRRILELSPHFVKLDIALVRSVDTDPARRAMIGAMVAFARETGCAIIAEGIERDEECDVLRALGVDFGQGYLLGRPAAVEAWTHVPQPDEQTAA